MSANLQADARGIDDIFILVSAPTAAQYSCPKFKKKENEIAGDSVSTSDIVNDTVNDGVSDNVTNDPIG